MITILSAGTLRQIFLIPYMGFCCSNLYIVIIKQHTLLKHKVYIYALFIVLLQRFLNCTACVSSLILVIALNKVSASKHPLF